jgi:predicted small secreted protein
MPRRALHLAVLLLALAAAGCASTRVIHQWSNPDFASPPRFKKLMVIGISQQQSIRRSFEDEFVARLKTAGVDAVPGYRFITEDGPVAEPRLREAVAQAGADATLVTRLVRMEQRYQVSPSYYPPPPGFGFYRGYAGAWYGYYDPQIYPYEVYISETSLYDTAKNVLVWSGAVETTSAGIGKDIAHYVEAVIEALQKRNLLAAS